VRLTGQDRLAAVERFDLLPPEEVTRALGVAYAHVTPAEGGDLYVTRFGWPLVKHLLPERWYADQWYAEHGAKLPGSTGHVYHVRTRPVEGRSSDLVVKFSRVAQEVPIVVETSFPDDVPPETIAAARFNSPMEEFGLVMELRRGDFGAPEEQVLTQRPLAIYAPPEEFQLWQLGRNTSWFAAHRRLLQEDQERADRKAIELDIRRIYVLLYGWVDGRDAEQSLDSGDISEQEFMELAPRVVRELRAKGFRVLDNKPKHYILRRKSNGGMLRTRNGKLAYALVDFEFLQRTPEHQERFKMMQEERYHRLGARQGASASRTGPVHLRPCRIFGVDYLYGSTQDGGRLWVVGSNEELFDYFIPDRWRRTPRVKLSPLSEVYRTRSRDHVHFVYRRSRVGSQPRIDPLLDSGRRMRAHGYNSPFEEIVIAERLRQMGVRTSIPRAVYRTAHQSTTAAFLRDNRRFVDHAGLFTPDDPPQPILESNYDYYTIWDYLQGFRPEDALDLDRCIDLDSGRQSGLLDSATCASIMSRATAMLVRFGLPEGEIDASAFAVYVDGRGRPRPDEHGQVDATFSVDALTAYEVGFIEEAQYRRVLERLAGRLRAVDCEKLDLRGSHLLLFLSPDGRLKADLQGELLSALCNFEFIRGLYRPIR
jgi:hypothetical protein